MKEDFRFRKLMGMIPQELYSELQSKYKFGKTWDNWLTLALRERLNKEAVEGDSHE